MGIFKAADSLLSHVTVSHSFILSRC